MRTLEGAARRLKPADALPRLWLVSDPRRLPDPRALAARLTPGAAVLARALAPAVLAAVAALARRGGLRLVVAADGILALRLHAGLQLPDRRPATGVLAFLRARVDARPGRRPILLVAAHGRAGLARARRLRADAVLLSPAFPTASHPGAPALGPLRWAALAARAGRPVVALGGVAPATARRLPRRWAAGLAAIDGFGPHGPARAAGDDAPAAQV